MALNYFYTSFQCVSNLFTLFFVTAKYSKSIDNEIIENHLFILKTRFDLESFFYYRYFNKVSKVSKEFYHNLFNHLTTRHKTFIKAKQQAYKHCK